MFGKKKAPLKPWVSLGEGHIFDQTNGVLVPYAPTAKAFTDGDPAARQAAAGAVISGIAISG